MDAVQSRRGKGLHLGKKVILILGYIFRNHSNFAHKKKIIILISWVNVDNFILMLCILKLKESK